MRNKKLKQWWKENKAIKVTTELDEYIYKMSASEIELAKENGLNNFAKVRHANYISVDIIDIQKE